MIDLKKLRDDPARFEKGAKAKGSSVDIQRLLELDEARRKLTVAQEAEISAQAWQLRQYMGYNSAQSMFLRQDGEVFGIGRA